MLDKERLGVEDKAMRPEPGFKTRKVRCTKCGHVWAVAAGLMMFRGHQCPACKSFSAGSVPQDEITGA